MRMPWGLGLVVLLFACSSRGAALGDDPVSEAADDLAAPLDGAEEAALDAAAPDMTAPDMTAPDARAPDVASMDGADASTPCRSSSECATGTTCSPLLRRCIECTADSECPTD